jgi:hypothetical protein
MHPPSLILGMIVGHVGERARTRRHRLTFGLGQAPHHPRDGSSTKCSPTTRRLAPTTMRWPQPGDHDDGSTDDKKANKPNNRRLTWSELASPSNWSWDNFTEPNTLLPSVVFTVTTISALRIYKSYLRRIPSVNHIKPGYFRSKTLFGQVTSVGDADNFRIFHTPGGRLAGWGWLPWKKVPSTREGLANNTVQYHISRSMNSSL